MECGVSGVQCEWSAVGMECSVSGPTHQLLRGSRRSLVSGSGWQVSWECLPTWQRGLGDWSTTCHTSQVLGTLEI